MKKQLLFLALSTILGATSVQAADTGFYLGGSFGQAKMSDFSGSDVDAVFASVGVTSRSTTDTKDDGWKVFAGYRIMKYLAVEGAYTNLGEASSRSVVTAPVPGTLNISAEAEAWSLSMLGILPLNDKFSLFGRLGFNTWNVDVKATGTGSGATTFNYDDKGTDVLYGVGASYHFTPNLNLRAEWERYNLDGNDVDFLSAGLGWSF